MHRYYYFRLFREGQQNWFRKVFAEDAEEAYRQMDSWTFYHGFDGYEEVSYEEFCTD